MPLLFLVKPKNSFFEIGQIDKNDIPSNELKTYKEMHLILDTNKGKFAFFRNIFNGPETTIMLTKNKQLIGWGKNKYNLLGLTGEYAKKTKIFPPRVLEWSYPKVEDIKQISIGFEHTLILLNNSTVMGIGSNMNGELGRDDINSTITFIEIKFPEYEAECIKNKTCTIEMVAAEKDVSFFVFNYGTLQEEKHVTLTPICNGSSYLDINVCSGNGMCVNNDKCECFFGYAGNNCERALDCSKRNDCSGNGYCSRKNTCQCHEFAGGRNCTKPVC